MLTVNLETYVGQQPEVSLRMSNSADEIFLSIVKEKTLRIAVCLGYYEYKLQKY